MLGAILGDIVGSVYEFNNTKSYDFEIFTLQSDYTDNRIMSLAVAAWIYVNSLCEDDKKRGIKCRTFQVKNTDILQIRYFGDDHPGISAITTHFC